MNPSPKPHKPSGRIRKGLLYALAVLAAVAALRFSFYTESLQEHRFREKMGEFRPEETVDYHWNHQRASLQDEALDFGEFLQALQTRPEQLASEHGRVLGIGSNTFFVVKGRADRFSLGTDCIACEPVPGVRARLATDFIFGSVARDATGWFQPGDFRTTMDFNTVSAYMNGLIVKEMAACREQLAQADGFDFCGAVEVNFDESLPEEWVIIPYTITLR